jgi:nuclear pore complex protein Nup205
MEERGTRGDGPDLAVNVLSASAWPTYPDVAVNLPPAISKVMAKFDEHYKSKHSGRKLTFKNALAHCQLKAKFPKGSKEIVVSGFQAVVLLLFNDVPTPTTAITYTDIKSATALSDAELKRTLQSLACAKYRVLTKDPKGRDVNETDKFTFNASFSDPKMRIKINQIQLKETKQENKETHQRVAADRHYETQAAIVRIMKSRKKIGHNDLIIEVIKATRSRGVLDQADIKKNIDKYVRSCLSLGFVLTIFAGSLKRTTWNETKTRRILMWHSGG